MADARGEYLEQIRRAGVALSPELAAAFAAVPREAFVPDGFQRPGGGWVMPADPDFLPTVYRDDVLVTRLEGRTPVSSSSQPSLMAIMIMALDVHAGSRVLEIGTGTGYNAALLAALGATVTTIDVRAEVADQARAALAQAGTTGVRVEHGDGYAGAPGERFDRVIVTVGVAGASPRWLDQMEPDGVVVAPVEHAGMHPVLVVRGARSDPPTATVVCPAGFMTAAGPLSAKHPGAHPPPAAVPALTAFADVIGARFEPPLDSLSYRDLWYAAGAWNRRATHAAVPGREHNCLVLLDEPRTGGALILPDGSVGAGGDQAARYAAEAVEIIDRWTVAGRPPMQAWWVRLALSGDPRTPIWVPTSWELSG